MDFFWLQKAPNDVKLCFLTKKVFLSKLWILFSHQKQYWGENSIFRRIQRINFWHGPKRLKKVLFFFKAWEKRVNHVLFTNHTLCDLKVCRSPAQNFFESVAQFLTILWSTLGGGKNPMFLPPPFSVNLDFTRNFVKCN